MGRATVGIEMFTRCAVPCHVTSPDLAAPLRIHGTAVLVEPYVPRARKESHVIQLAQNAVRNASKRKTRFGLSVVVDARSWSPFVLILNGQFRPF